MSVDWPATVEATGPAELLILEGVATLQEIETWYSLDDVLDRLDALTAYRSAERAAAAARGAT